MLGFLLKLYYNYRSFGGVLASVSKEMTFGSHFLFIFALFSSFHLIWMEWAPFYSFLWSVLLELSLLYKHSKLWMPPCFLAAYYTLCTFLVSFGLKHFQISLGIASLIFGSLEINSLIFFKLFEEFGKHFLMWTLIVAGFLSWFVFIWFSSFKFIKTCFVVQFIVYLIDFICTWEKNVVLGKISIDIR